MLKVWPEPSTKPLSVQAVADPEGVPSLPSVFKYPMKRNNLCSAPGSGEIVFVQVRLSLCLSHF